MVQDILPMCVCVCVYLYLYISLCECICHREYTLSHPILKNSEKYPQKMIMFEMQINFEFISSLFINK